MLLGENMMFSCMDSGVSWGQDKVITGDEWMNEKMYYDQHHRNILKKSDYDLCH